MSESSPVLVLQLVVVVCLNKNTDNAIEHSRTFLPVCRFDTVCAAPGYSTMRGAIGFRIDQLTAVISSSSFVYYRDMNLSSVFPLSGSDLGGTR